MWLAIDTSADQAAAAAGDAGGPRAERSLRGARQHAAQVLPMIEAVLAEAGASLATLEGVLLADGPGSFTGLRVGAAVAKGLAAARGLEVRTAPALLILAAGALPPHRGPVLALTDALRGDVYAAVYDVQEASVSVVQAPTVVKAADAAALASRGVATVGTAHESVLAAVAARLSGPRLQAPMAPAVVLL